ncbi:MAG: FG-GAP repeat protein [uncultured bacterium]|nr:MAG: FG-GAP repeat protein [uncultured bacterium]
MQQTSTKTISTTRTVAALAVLTVTATLAGSLVIQQLAQSSAQKAAIVIGDLDEILTEFESTPTVLRSDNAPGSVYGSALAQVGDVNGDGYEDLVVADYEDGSAGSSTGAVYGYYGSASGVATTADWTVIGDGLNYQFGYSVDAAGDVNNDGYADVLIGERSAGDDAQGSVHLYYGSTSGLATTSSWTANGSDDNQYFGNDVAGIGDINGDGYDDIAVTTGLANEPSSSGGTLVSVFYGSATTPNTTADWSYMDYSSQFFEQVNNLAGAGDVNGDGYADMVLGSPEFIRSSAMLGQINIFLGSATGFTRLPNAKYAGRVANARFGLSVTGAGDVNNDGYDDVMVGAPDYTNIESQEGAVAVYYGSATGLSRVGMWTKESNVTNAYYGVRMSPLGDIDGNGYTDMLVGAPLYPNAGGTGVAYIRGGSATGVLRLPLGMDGARDASTDEYATSLTSGVTLSGTSGVDIVVGVGQYDDGTSGPAVLVYNDVSL